MPEGVVRDRLLQHSQDALADIYKLHSAVVFNVALKVTGNRNAAEDVTQGVFLDLWHRPARFDPAKGKLRPWLAVCAHHRSIDWIRQEEARRIRERRTVESMVGHLLSIEDTVAASLTADRVRRALRQLHENERTPICLAYFRGLTYAEVAQELGVPEGTIKSRIRTGLRRLACEFRSEMADLCDARDAMRP